MRGILLFCVVLVRLVFSENTDPEPLSICGPEKELVLSYHGADSARTVILTPPTSDGSDISVCKLKVTASKTHVVNLQFLDDVGRNDTDKQQCPMTIYLPDNRTTPFWKGDPCMDAKLPDVDLLTSEFKIVWTPPENATSSVPERTMLLTAVGSGPFCKDAFQHTCMRIGRIPMLCVSDHLICDGVQNCPKSATNSDEDPRMCKTAKNAWETFVVQLVKKYRPEEAGLLPLNHTSEGEAGWLEWQLFNKTSTPKPEVLNETHSASESISAMLNKYGPWGYLMMGLLICGTVLFFCGLWECCCKRPKPEGDPPPATTATTVLVMNCDTPNSPPEYSEMDLPPSYSTLFPAEEGRYTALDEREVEVEEEEKSGDFGEGTSGLVTIAQVNSEAESESTSQEETTGSDAG